MNTPCNNKLIIISLDALKADDIDFMKTLPNFSELLKTGVHAKRVKTIYPSITYPAHTTIVTGNYPKNHGIINNKLMEPSSKLCPWFWYRKYIKTPTLYDAAKENNLKVASIFWPVSANSSIEYNMPEIFSYKKYISQELISLLTGNIPYQLKLFKKYSHMKSGIKEPELDDFAIACSIDTLKDYSPDVLMVHLLDLDSQRHAHGTNSKEAYESLERHDLRIGKLIATLKDLNVYDKTNFVILGDHGFQDYENVISLNGVFKNNGLLSVDNKNNLISWDSYLKSCDGSAYIYLKNPSDEKLKNKVENLILQLQTDSNYGIKAIYNNKELINLGCDPDATFMVDAAEGFAFSEKTTDEVITSALSSTKKAVGTHGYCPENPNLDTLFIAQGPSFKNNFSIDNMQLIDVAPTLAKALNISFYPCDGTIINDFFLTEY